MLSMPDFTFFQKVVHKLNGSNVLWGIFAGAAVKIYGGTRPITDIDILTPTDAGKHIATALPDAIRYFDEDGRISGLELPDIEIIAGLTRSLTFLLDEEMIARLHRGTLLGVDVPALSVEDNLAFKVILGRGPEVGKHDWEDIDALLSRYAPDWDYLYLRLERSVPARADALFAQLQQHFANC